MRRHPAAIICAFILTLAMAIPVMAISINVSPNSQSRDSGEQASWTSSWTAGQGGPYVATLRPDDGSPTKSKNVSGLSTSFTHKYYECYYSTFDPVGKVYDQDDHQDMETVFVAVNAGPLC